MYEYMLSFNGQSLLSTKWSVGSVLPTVEIVCSTFVGSIAFERQPKLVIWITLFVELDSGGENSQSSLFQSHTRIKCV